MNGASFEQNSFLFDSFLFDSGNKTVYVNRMCMLCAWANQPRYHHRITAIRTTTILIKKKILFPSILAFKRKILSLKHTIELNQSFFCTLH